MHLQAHIKKKALPLVVILTVALAGCITGAKDISGWAKAGQQDEYINSLKANRRQVYAATRTDLYRKSLLKPADWKSLGIKQFIDGRAVRDFIVFSENELLAGVGSYPEFEEGTIPLWRTTTGGENWEPYQNGFGEEGNYGAFRGIEGTPTMDTLFAASGAIARSVNRGKSWEPVHRSWNNAPSLLFVTVDQTNPQNIWSGGSAFILESQLYKSSDYGKSWSFLQPLEHTEATVYDLVIHPDDSDRVLTGLESNFETGNVIRRSVDGGQTWETVFEGIGVRALAQSPRDGRRVYASGINATGTLSFAKTDDFGDTWDLVEHEDGPAGIWVNDLVAVEQNGREILYFGTNKGVYSYTFID